MKKLNLLFAAALVFTVASVAAVASPVDVTPLSNKDVLSMVEHKIATEAIIQSIKSSPCTFDTFPSVLKELKRRGVPEEVLEAMLDAPYGPPANSRNADDLAEQPIYHYMEQIKQYLTAVPSSRRTPAASTRTRAARTRTRM